MEDFKALELCINKIQDYHNIRRHIMDHGVYRRDSLGVPRHMGEERDKLVAIGVLEKMFKIASEREEELCDEANDRLREYWDESRPGQYGLCHQPTDDWPNSKHLGYQMLQVLLINNGLLTSEQMQTLKVNPAGHLPRDLCVKLNRMGVEADPRTIRRHIIEAAKTYFG